MVADETVVLEALDPEQQAVATALRGPVCVLAGAGTGKTRAITHRIATGVLSGVYDPRRVLAVTFTTRAAGEMRGRLSRLGAVGVQARTFHSAALRQARYFWPRVVGRSLPSLIDRKYPLLTEAARRCRLDVDSVLLRDLASEVEWAKVTNVRPEDYVAAARAARREVAGVDAATVARAYSAYEDVKADRDVMDMEDVLLAAVGLLDTHPGVADVVREQYHHFVVDEYQDVSPLQQRLLELWLGDRNNICVVGDPAQTIYSFAGARPDYLLGFTRRFPDATVVRLVRNYRSTPQVVHVANTLLRGGRDSAATASVTLQAQRPAGPAPVYRDYPDDVAEADAIAGEIAKLVASGVAPREIAVLFRINAQSEVYEQALADAGIPYLLRGGERFFDRPEIRQAAMLLRGAARAGEGTDDVVGDVRATLSGVGWSPHAPSGAGAARERWEALTALVSLAEELVATQPGARLGDVVAEFDARAVVQHAPVADGVTLASLHAAKGLEWDSVFIVGCHDGMIPITYAETPEQLAEERRLLYVGVTRAQRILSISWARARTPGAPGSRRPSRFLDGVRPESRTAPTDAPAARRARAVRAPARCRVCGKPLREPAERKLRRCVDCPVDLDRALYDALREWRLDTARRQGVPAFCIFTDATLTAIAEVRPTDERTLAQVPGVGAVKLKRYAPDILRLCAPQ